MTDSARALEIAFRWRRLPVRVDVRTRRGWREKLEEAVRRGERIPRRRRHEVLTYSFEEVHQAMPALPGIYLIEAFHTGGGPPPDPGSMPKETWSEVVDAHHEADEDPDHELPRGGDPLWFYIGATVNLKRRFEEHEQRGSALFRHVDETVAAEDSWLRASLQLDQRITYGGDPGDVDLTSSLVRVLLEHAAIADYRREHPETPMVNIDGRRPTEVIEAERDDPEPEPDDFTDGWMAE